VTDLAFYQNRLHKNVRRLGKWAARDNITALRVYDRDIPEFPLIVERFQTEAGVRVHLQEVDTGWQQSAAEHREWLDFIVEATAQTLAVPPEHVAVKRRARQRVQGDKSAQYSATGRRGEELVVLEAGHRFLLDLEAHLDTGLFLDHRATRARVAAAAAGKRFLNLFAYTGSFTVYAACAGAQSSVSVDLSNTYLDWARRNWALNRIDATRHELVRADVSTWLRGAVAQNLEFDLIVLDPPSFSNSKRMAGILDVQRDHPWLIRQCLALLARRGELFFSTNLRSFELDAQVQTRAQFQELSPQSIPEDFRDRRIHRLWHIRR
jgi:23S rRNA (cytosine1962-C5)-methyltransferase